MAEVVSEQPVLTPEQQATRGQYLYHINKDGYLARSERKYPGLSPEERAKRDAEEKAKREGQAKEHSARGAEVGFRPCRHDEDFSKYLQIVATLKMEKELLDKKAKLGL